MPRHLRRYSQNFTYYVRRWRLGFPGTWDSSETPGGTGNFAALCTLRARLSADSCKDAEHVLFVCERIGT